MGGVRNKRKAETAERLLAIRAQLADYRATTEGPPIRLATESVGAAIQAHRAFLRGPGQNMLVPRPKADTDKPKRAGQWRRLDGGNRAKR